MCICLVSARFGSTRRIAGVTGGRLNLPASGFYAMKDLLALTLAAQRIEVALLGAMAVLALVLSDVGIFALVTNTVAQRTREIGIRMALGSTIQTGMVQIGKSGVIALPMDLYRGLILCMGTLRVMRSFLYGVDVYDAPTIVPVVLTLSAVALLATIVPALRVARINHATTLREEWRDHSPSDGAALIRFRNPWLLMGYKPCEPSGFVPHKAQG